MGMRGSTRRERELWRRRGMGGMVRGTGEVTESRSHGATERRTAEGWTEGHRMTRGLTEGACILLEMSALPKPLGSDIGYAGLRMTADDYLGLGETQERYELINGVVFMSPSPTPRHSEI